MVGGGWEGEGRCQGADGKLITRVKKRRLMAMEGRGEEGKGRKGKIDLTEKKREMESKRKEMNER